MQESPQDRTRRNFPSIEKLSHALRHTGIRREVRVEVARRVVARQRRDPSSTGVGGQIEAQLRLLLAGQRRVINATGIVLHTGLGRAPLGEEAVKCVQEILCGYSDLEVAVGGKGCGSPKRGDRARRVELLASYLSGAEACVAVNNGAAALLLSLHALSRRKRVLVSRGELVQIGGGFRIPDILSASGAKLVEVGTTNITTIQDYASPLQESPALSAILKVHPSCFQVKGHVESVSLKTLARLARSHKIPLLCDLGSGCLRDPVLGEPTVSRALQQGASLVIVSGDKLLGGPQAGLILGSADLVRKLKRAPLYRALRLDKVGIVLLEYALRMLVQGRETPAQRLLGLPLVKLRHRAERLQRLLKARGIEVAVLKGQGAVGGGALPEIALPSFLLDLGPEQTAARLLAQPVPIVTRVSQGRCLADVRTVLDRDELDFVEGVVSVCSL